jgi:hypothetical protein
LENDTRNKDTEKNKLWHVCFLMNCFQNQNLEKGGRNVKLQNCAHVECSTYEQETEKSFICDLSNRICVKIKL